MILAGIPADRYVGDAFHEGPPALSSSVAHVLLTRSALHARVKHPRLNPAWVSEATKAAEIGTAAHAVLLENDRSRIVVVDAANWQKKDAQIQRTIARLEGKIPVLGIDMTAIERMVVVAKAKLADCPDLAGIPVDSLLAERTILWQAGDAWGQAPEVKRQVRIPSEAPRFDTAFVARVSLRCRPDWMAPDHSLIVSYKTTGNAEPDAFARQILSMGYDTQAAFELAGVKDATGKDARYVWLVQEVDEPYACSLIGLSPALAAMAASKYRVAVERWAACVAENRWPAYPERICWIEPPAWAVGHWTEKENAHDNERHPVEGVEAL